MYTDPISDYLTRIRNANSSGHRVVDIPASKIKKEITKILFDQGYILSYKFEDTQNNQGNIKVLHGRDVGSSGRDVGSRRTLLGRRTGSSRRTDHCRRQELQDRVRWDHTRQLPWPRGGSSKAAPICLVGPS